MYILSNKLLCARILFKAYRSQLGNGKPEANSAGGEGWQLTMNVGYSMTSVEWYGESLGSCRMGVVTGKTEARL
jgi:hypothetical protein